MLPFWGRCTTHFSGGWDVHWGYDFDFDPWPCGFSLCNDLPTRRLKNALQRPQLALVTLYLLHDGDVLTALRLQKDCASLPRKAPSSA